MIGRGKSSILRIVVLIVASAFLVGFAGRPEWGDPSKRVWYYGRLVPFGELLDQGIVPQCHDGRGRGVITCYDTKEELAAATGVDVAGVDAAEVGRLRSSDAVAEVQGDWYACLWDGAGLTGRSFLLMYDYADLKEALFDNITSSIQIPAGAGYSSYYADPGYGGISWAFYTTKAELGPMAWITRSRQCEGAIIRPIDCGWPMPYRASMCEERGDGRASDRGPASLGVAGGRAGSVAKRAA